MMPPRNDLFIFILTLALAAGLFVYSILDITVKVVYQPNIVLANTISESVPSGPQFGSFSGFTYIP